MRRVANQTGPTCDLRYCLQPALGQTKIQQDDIATLSQLQVLRLDIPMQNRRLLPVQVVEGVQELVGPAQYLWQRERRSTAQEQGMEILAGDELHHQKLTSRIRKMV